MVLELVAWYVVIGAVIVGLHYLPCCSRMARVGWNGLSNSVVALVFVVATQRSAGQRPVRSVDGRRVHRSDMFWACGFAFCTDRDVNGRVSVLGLGGQFVCGNVCLSKERRKPSGDAWGRDFPSCSGLGRLVVEEAGVMLSGFEDAVTGLVCLVRHLLQPYIAGMDCCCCIAAVHSSCPDFPS